MAFLKIEKSLMDDAHSANQTIKMNNDDRVVWSIIREYNNQGRPLVMCSKNFAAAAGVNISSLRRIIKKLDQAGLIVRKRVPNNPQNLQATWAAPLGELLISLNADHVSTWAERNDNLTPAPELLPPSMQAYHSKAASTADEIPVESTKDSRLCVDGVHLHFNDPVLAHLWKDFAAMQWDKANGHISTHSLQFLANDLKKANTAIHAVYYLQHALTSGSGRIAVPEDAIQAKQSQTASHVYDAASRYMEKHANDLRRDQWADTIEKLREQFASCIEFDLLESFKFNRFEADTNAVHVDLQDYEHLELFEELADNLQGALKAEGWANLAYELPRVEGEIILSCNHWNAQKEAYKARFSREFVALDIAKEKGRNLGSTKSFDSLDQLPFLTDSNNRVTIAMPWNSLEFKDAASEWIDYQAEQWNHVQSTEGIERMFAQLAIHYSSEEEAIEAIHNAITNGWKSFNADNLHRLKSKALSDPNEEAKLREYALTGRISTNRSPVL